MKPRKRGRLRLFLGVNAYRIKRYMEWCFGRTRYALHRDSETLPSVHAQHRTPLLRKLRDVEMWMQTNKVINLRIAARRLNGVVVHPGETFSYWRLIGKPTKRKGYVEGMMLSHGRVTPGIGGGLCQLSNLIYWMTLHTPLTVTERYRHSYDVFPDANRNQPFGSGATCFYNYLDLQIRNDTQQPYQLTVYLTDTDLVGEWRSTQPATRRYEVYEREHRISPAIWGGYERYNQLYRRVYAADGEWLEDEFVTENRAVMMYEPLLPEGEHC
jgi:vancomycin resistance protein VanW